MTATAVDGARPDPGGPGILARLARRVVLPAVLVVALLVVLASSVFPTATWLDQRRAIADRRAQLVELEAANQALAQRVAALGTATEVERIARRDHGLVRPGEEAYAVLPAAPEPVRIPPAWPFTELAEALER